MVVNRQTPNAMKATITLLALVLVQATATAAVPLNVPPGTASTSNSIALERSLSKQLNKHITFPIQHQGASFDGTVDVSFVIDKEGKVEVLNITATNDALRSYVLRKLGKVDIGENPSGTWKTSHVRFVFRPEA
jgi:outer membrane biosynthesis protein TonB